MNTNNRFDKRKKRIFIIEIRINEDRWSGIYTVGQIFHLPIKSNNKRNPEETFMNYHWGSEYPDYDILNIEDCWYSGFFNQHLLD